MNDDIKRQFIRATLQFKKVDLQHLSQGQIPYTEYVVLGWVRQCPHSGGCLNVGEIAQHLCVSRPAVSQILSSLEGKGYIVRQIDPSDRRRITVRFTDAGQQVMAESEACYEKALERFLASISPEDLHTLTRLMNRLCHIYQELSEEN